MTAGTLNKAYKKHTESSSSCTKNNCTTCKASFEIFLIAFLMIFVEAFLVQIAWNLSIAEIFETVPKINFIQALALNLLVEFLIT